MELLELERFTCISSRSSSEDWGTDSDEYVSDTDYNADMALIERALAEHERERLPDCDLIKEIEAMDRALEETRGGWLGPTTTVAATPATAKPTGIEVSPPPLVQPVTRTLAGAKFFPPETPSAEGFLVGHPTIRVMADIEPDASTDNVFFVSIANTKPTKSTMLVENEVTWWLQRARCVLKRRKDTRRQKKARRMANLKRQAAVLKNNVGRYRQPRHRNKREEHKVIAPASGQRRRRLFKEDLHGKVKTRKEGGAPGECVPLPGFLNYFFTHLINCMLGCFLVVWSTNAALSGCLVRGQLV
jgi:hypothetical protein